MLNAQKSVDLLGVRIDNVSLDFVLEFIKNIINSDEKAVISNVNVHGMNLCYENRWFREFINCSQLVFCDGYGVRLGALLTGHKLNYRFTPPDWIDDLCRLAVENNFGLFFLGAKSGVAELAADRLCQRYPRLRIKAHHGYFDHYGMENENIVRLINESNAQILMVGMGMPLQERWIKENFEKFSNVNVFLPVGALFDYAAKIIPRGPRFLTDHGLEWLARLVIEPKRLWHRYIVGNPKFFFRLATYQFKKTKESK